MPPIAGSSVSLDGFITGPDDRPGQGLGVGGERLHYWVFGGPWTYDGETDFGGMSGEDKVYYDGLTARIGSGIVGRGMYDAAGAWGGKNPFPGTLAVLTHSVEDPHDESVVFACGRAGGGARGPRAAAPGGAVRRVVPPAPPSLPRRRKADVRRHPRAGARAPGGT